MYHVWVKEKPANNPFLCGIKPLAAARIGVDSNPAGRWCPKCRELTDRAAPQPAQPSLPGFPLSQE